MPKPTKKTYASVPRLWPGETCVCIASGPSLTQEDVDYVRGKVRTIVVNNCFQLAPWADVLWATDRRWWKWFKSVPEWKGLKFSLGVVWTETPKDIHLLRSDGHEGLCLDPSGVRHGKNGGYAALNLALHLGCARVILLGYDAQRTNNRDHWHPDHPFRMPNPYASWVRLFRTIAGPLKAAGVEVINCSRQTAIDCFPRMPLREALPEQRREAVA